MFEELVPKTHIEASGLQLSLLIFGCLLVLSSLFTQCGFLKQIEANNTNAARKLSWLLLVALVQVPVSCRELMKSFGWDTADAFMQHDAQDCLLF